MNSSYPSKGRHFIHLPSHLGGDELLKELMYYGISAIALATTGSERTEGLRACTSLTPREQFPVLEKRLRQFNADHPLTD